MDAAATRVVFIDHVYRGDVAIFTFEIDVACALAGSDAGANRDILMAAICVADIQINEVNRTFGHAEPDTLESAAAFHDNGVVIDRVSNIACAQQIPC